MVHSVVIMSSASASLSLSSRSLIRASRFRFWGTSLGWWWTCVATRIRRHRSTWFETFCLRWRCLYTIQTPMWVTVFRFTLILSTQIVVVRVPFHIFMFGEAANADFAMKDTPYYCTTHCWWCSLVVRSSVFSRWTFPDLCPIYSWQVFTFWINCLPTRPTEPSIPLGR